MSRYTSPRALGLLVVALVLISTTVVLGLWQLGVYDNRQREDAESTLQRTPVSLDDVLGPDEGMQADAVSAPVTVDGQYVAADQFYIEDLAGATHRYAVVTPLLTSTGSAILVVRGSTDTPQARVPTAGTVQVTGVLEPSQADAVPLTPARVTDAIKIAALVSEVHDDLYDGYVVLRSSRPADDLATVQPPVPDPSRWAGLRNLLYALQWWLFAGFVAFMWWRVVTDADEFARSDVR